MFRSIKTQNGMKYCELSLKQREMLAAYRLYKYQTEWPTPAEAFNAKDVKSESQKRESKLRTILE